MASSKDSLKSLCDIIKDDVQFVVPDYQRGYSWENSQRDDLWEDLGNITGDRSHYTGMFTFCRVNPDDKVYQIVDGQQRMTTLIILINELLSKIDGGIPNGSSVEEYKKKYLYKQLYGSLSKQYRFQYSVDNPSDAFFKTQILNQEEASSYSQPEDTLYTKNLREAKSYFADKIKDMGQSELAELFIKVTEKLKFNEYLIEDLDEVYVTFETMNNRGKNLSTLELLKNRLIYLSTLYSNIAQSDVDRDNVTTLRKNINDAWKTIYEYLGKSTKKTLNDDAFLRDHWIMYFHYDRSASMVFRKELLSDNFTAKNVLNGKLAIETINNYVLNLQKCVVIWFNINCPIESVLPEDSKIWHTRLNRVGIGSFRPLLMAAYVHSLNSSDVLPLVKACERFRFLVSSVSARRSNTSDSHFYTLAHDYFTNPKSYNLVDDVNWQTNNWTSLPNFINACVDRYNHQEGFYSWAGLRYFLYEYESHLQNTNEVKVEWETFEKNQAGKVSIEHIYPQTPSDNYWQDRFVTDYDKALTHSLGNLLLLSKSKNSAQQNYSFEVKKLTTRDVTTGEIIHNGYDNGSYSELAVAQESEWTPDAIIKRGQNMLNFLISHWNIKYTLSNEERDQLLNIHGKTPAPSPIVEQLQGDFEDIEDEVDNDEQ